ncbi:hypothetical protein Tco_0336092 [Tanacetum coccineum]
MFCTSPELIVPGVKSLGPGPELNYSEAIVDSREHQRREDMISRVLYHREVHAVFRCDVFGLMIGFVYSKLSRLLLPKEITGPLKRSTLCEQLPLKYDSVFRQRRSVVESEQLMFDVRLRLLHSVVRFGKKGKSAPRFVGPFEIIKKVGLVAYRLDLPKELNGVHDTFHVSNLKKCLADPTLQVPLDEIQFDAKLNFVEKPVEILEREFMKIKRSRIAIVKVRWNSKRSPEFTWECED